MRVLSGYRSPRLNAAVGGSATSQHLCAEAADLAPANGRDALALFALLRARAAGGAALPHGQVIYYPDRGFAHVALPSRRYPHPAFFVARDGANHRVTPSQDLRALLGGAVA